MSKLLQSYNKPYLNKGYFLLIITPLLLLAYAYYLQYYQGLSPCPLCSVQRGEYFFISIFSLLSFLFYRFDFRKISGGLMFFAFIASLLGIITSARHVWTQMLPESEIPSCGPDLTYMLNAFPLQDVIAALFTGDGTCADVQWSFLSLSIPAWALIWFSIYFLTSAIMTHLILKIRNKTIL